MKVSPVLIFVTSPTQLYTLRLIAEALLDNSLASPQVIVIDEEEYLDFKLVRSDIPIDYLGVFESLTEKKQLSRSAVRQTIKSNTCSSLSIEQSSKKGLSNIGRHILKRLPGISVLQNWRTAIREHYIVTRAASKQVARKNDLIGMLEKIQPLAVVIPGDRGLGDQPALLAACKSLNVLTVIPPTSFSCPIGILARTRTDVRYRASTKFMKRYPNQVWRDDRTGNKVSFFPKRDTQVLDRAGMLPEFPQILGGGHSDLLLVDSEASKDNAISQGVSSKKIRVTGHPDTDQLYNAFVEKNERRASVVNRYNLDSNNDIVILNLPLFDDVDINSAEESQIHGKIISEIADSYDTCLISTHPRMSQSHKVTLSRKYPIRILEERLADILPAADIYISDQTSTTIYWALLSEVPTISLNWSWYTATGMMKNIPEVFLAESQDRFREILLMLADKELQIRTRRLYRENKYRYGRFDGKSMKRITDIISQPYE